MLYEERLNCSQHHYMDTYKLYMCCPLQHILLYLMMTGMLALLVITVIIYSITYQITKYLNNNTQLRLLPGIHYLHDDLVLQNIQNFSLIGTFYNNGKSPSIIHCVNPSSLIVVNTTELRIKYVTIANCTKK